LKKVELQDAALAKNCLTTLCKSFSIQIWPKNESYSADANAQLSFPANPKPTQMTTKKYSPNKKCSIVFSS
jgi:hypothetical protein